MQISSLAKYAVGVTVAAALLAGCSSGGGSSLSPSTSAGAQGVAGPGHALSYHGVLLASRMMPQVRPIQIPAQPDKKKKKGAIQYISNFYSSAILQFNYPKSDASTGTISGTTDPQGMCTKTGKGTWWVVSSGSDTVDEFKAGGTSPINSLSVTVGEPAGCAIDSKGDIAVSVLGTGDVVIFTGGTGSGTEVSDGLVSTYFLGYDKSGNLFADGITTSYTYGMVELAAGGSSFSSVTLPNTISFPGQVQYDGKYITLDDQSAASIYQYSVSGGVATLAGTVPLSGAVDCVQTWIAGKIVICPDAGAENGKIYAYPAGGTAKATLSGSFDLPIGSVQVKK